MAMAGYRDTLVCVFDIGDVLGQPVACLTQRHGSHTASLAKTVGTLQAARYHRPTQRSSCGAAWERDDRAEASKTDEMDTGPKFVRFQSPEINRHGLHTGVFGLTNALGKGGALTAEDYQWWRESNAWCEATYTDPSTIDPQV